MVAHRLCIGRHFLQRLRSGPQWTLFDEFADMAIVPHVMCRQAAVAVGAAMDVHFDPKDLRFGGDIGVQQALVALCPDSAFGAFADAKEPRGSEATPSRARKLMIPDDQICDDFFPVCRSVLKTFESFRIWCQHDIINAYVLTDDQRVDILALLTSSIKGDTLPEVDKMGRLSNVLVQYVRAGKRPDAIQDFIEHKDHQVLDLWMERRPVTTVGYTRVCGRTVSWTKWDPIETEIVIYWTSMELRTGGRTILFAFYPQRRVLMCNDFESCNRQDASRQSIFLSMVLDPVKRKQRGDLFERHHKKWTRILPKWKPVYDRTKDPKDMIGSVLRADVVRESVAELIVV
jgi:hypothetical protein